MILIGGVAQLGERLNGIQKVMGSIPTVSTNPEQFVRGYVIAFLHFVIFIILIYKNVIDKSVVYLVIIIFDVL